ncbi:MAG: LysM peptidoglycan-binding domain-containing protein [Moorellales bacterium]
MRFLRQVLGVFLWVAFFELCAAVFLGQAQAEEAAYWGYRVNSGDTIWLLAQRYGCTPSEIQALNRIGASLEVGQFLYLPVKQQGEGFLYCVQPGDTLYLLSRRHNREIDAIRRLSGIEQDLLYPGQRLVIPIARAGYQPYRVGPGDTLFLLARRFNTSVDNLKQLNGLVGEVLLLGQWLQVPSDRPSEADRGAGTPEVVLYRVVPGDTLAALAQRYGTTVSAIYVTNRLHSEVLMPGQPLYIPVGRSEPVAIAGPRGEQRPGYGELLDWEWARWIYNPGAVATLTDFYTGRSFRVRHLGGSNHADSEPLTSADTAVMKAVFGGSWSWSKRPALLDVEGRVLAASMAGMPHDVQTIWDNNFPGHFDLYFWNSRSHNTNALDPVHQQNVLIAAGK